MPSSLLIDVVGLCDLESSKQWRKACELLYSNWRSDPHDVDKLVRAALQCWYVYLEAPVIGCAEDSATRAKLQHMLLSCAQYGRTHCQDRFAFLWAMCYMIGVSPEPFAVGDDSTKAYLHWESIGAKLRARGREQFASHPMAQLAFGDPRDAAGYTAGKAAIAHLLDQYFPGDSELDKYFREMYSM